MKIANKFLMLLAGAAGLAMAPAAFAAAGHPVPWQMGLQDSVTQVSDGIHFLHNYILMPIITFIVLLVMALLIYVMVRYNAKANPVPSKTTHNTIVEVIWTVLPIVILVVIAVPSFRLLYLERDIPNNADLTVKITGTPAWNWKYAYPDLGVDSDGNANVEFDSFPKSEEAAAKDGTPYLLSADMPMVVPVNKTVKLIVTSDPIGIIHAWTIPSFGVKIDAIPGRLNEDWFNARAEGVYYGQCSELCGKNHAFMPIEVWVVSDDKYKAWSDLMKTGPDDAKLKDFLGTIKPPGAQIAQN